LQLNAVLLSAVLRHVLLSIDISRPSGPQQQTRRTPRLWSKMGQTDGQTDGHSIVT